MLLQLFPARVIILTLLTHLHNGEEGSTGKSSWGQGRQIRADFWEGDATKHFSVKKGVFSEKGGGNSVN